ncbi:MAG: hypothetical protein M0P57_13495 [Syntrophales bacterium]|jgi:N-acetylneuraminic acid mutarotase|nr:hypothetical protein [Syntrophales bacterium]MDY0045271.1 hypothetical protein [Syntrophales bacterium]
MKNTLIVFSLFFVLIIIAPSAVAQTGIWETCTAAPTVRWEAAGGVIDGKLYAAGGSDGANSLATLEVYDPATGVWTIKSPMPTARNGAGGAVINGKLYVAGGEITRDGIKSKTAVLEAYDPVTDTWQTKTSMAVARSTPGTSEINGKLFVAGGCTGYCAPVTSILEVYDPATDTWATKASMPTGRGGTDTVAVNGILFIMGGCCGFTSSETDLMIRTIEAYDPVLNSWTSRTPHVVGSSNAAGSINGRIYVAKFEATEAYDPATDAWTSLPQMPTPRRMAVAGVINGTLYVAGGHDGLSGSSVMEAFTPFNGLPGDANIDGTLGLEDVIHILQILSGIR